MTNHDPERPEDEKERRPSQCEPEHQVSRSNEQAWTFIIIGIVLLTALLSYSRLGPSAVKKPGSDIPKTASGVPQLSPSMVPVLTGEEPIEEVLTKAGCAVCHTIPGIRGAEGRVGPVLNLGRTGPMRLADAGYRGQARTVHEYVIESVLSPGVYVVPGFPDRVMPRWYGQKLSAAALEKVASYLESRGEDSGTAKP